MHTPRARKQRREDIDEINERGPLKVGRRVDRSGGNSGGDANKLYSIVATLDQATFRGVVIFICGFGSLMRGNPVTE